MSGETAAAPLAQKNVSYEKWAESEMNLALLDPARYGWPAVGPVRELIAPQEKARRKAAKKAFKGGRKKKRKLCNPSFLKSPPTAASVAAVAVAATATATATATTTTAFTVDQSQTSAVTTDIISTEAKASAEKKQGENVDDNDETGNESKQSNPQNDDTAPHQPAEEKARARNEDGNDSMEVNTAVSGPKDKDATKSGDEKANSAQSNTAEDNSNQEEEEEAEMELFETSADSQQKIVKTRALGENGELNIYAYHRGLQGMEPRDPATGDLLCDLPPTDTNHKNDEPKLTLNVTVKFPIVDEDDIKRLDKDDWPMFEDVIPWNLGDPETPTPMGFAAITAETFGLTFGQTVDLATSIQEQIYRHMREHCGYADPVALTDGAGIERVNYPPHTVCHLYGAVSQNEPGSLLAVVPPPSSRNKARSAARQSQGGNQGTTSRRSSYSGASRTQSRPPPVVYHDEDPLEIVYKDDVQRRMLEWCKSDLKEKSSNFEGPVGSLQMKEDYVCHICHKRDKLVGLFACGHRSHAYCRMHLKQRLQIDVNNTTDQVQHECCPVCALTCTCSKCNRRLEALGHELRRRSKEQGTDVANTEFANIQHCYTKPIQAVRIPREDAPKRHDSLVSEEDDSNAEPALKRRKSELKTATVKKIAATEFPREVTSKGVDNDPGSRDDYLTVYTSDGTYLRDPRTMPTYDKPKSTSPTNAGEVEDGNISYCIVCRNAGDLICCDFCPRAYHRECREGPGREMRDGTTEKWECQRCLGERGGLPEYTLTGQAWHEETVEAYKNLPTTSEDDLKQIGILAKLQEMLSKLLAFDFGFIFEEPVDSEAVPDYTKWVSHPMDLGTVSTRLSSGHYAKFFDSINRWSAIHLAVLRDIELVWHNCFTFNREGSAVYRMATVGRLRMLGMKSRSLDESLDQYVKENLDKYVRAKDKERGHFTSNKDDLRPQSRHKIQIKGHGGIPRRVAILDPATGMVVKIYSTMKNAALAAEFLTQKRNHASEFPLVNYNSIKQLVDRSPQDPAETLFGYRWLEYDVLREGGVSFSTGVEPSKPVIIEMVTGEATYIFYSVDMALSCAQLPIDLVNDVAKKVLLRQKLQNLKEEEGMLEAGLTWRRRTPIRSEKEPRKGATLSSFITGGEQENKEERQFRYLPANVVIVKEDKTLDLELAGFENANAAYSDWESVCRGSADFSKDEVTRSHFDEYYLDGERNVDGVVWRSAGNESTGVAGKHPRASLPIDGATRDVEQGVQNTDNDITFMEESNANKRDKATLPQFSE